MGFCVTLLRGALFDMEFRRAGISFAAGFMPMRLK
tara:strand:- start:1 stop:105 length:105 start_codon:yes stop_codon:yes gene_type:complete